MSRFVCCFFVLSLWQLSAVLAITPSNYASTLLLENDSLDSIDGVVKNPISVTDTIIEESPVIQSDTLSKAQRDSMFNSLREKGTDEESDSSVVFRKRKKSPKFAGLLSAALPGAGQVYNRGWRAWWKVGIIYGGVYLLYSNISLYTRTKEFYHGALVIHDQDTTSEVIESDLELYADNYENLDDYVNLTGAQFANLAQADIQLRYDDYRSTLQNMYVFSALLYGLNILDAVVDAHLRTFDVSDDLTMRIKPSVLNMTGTREGLGPAISVKLSLK